MVGWVVLFLILGGVGGLGVEENGVQLYKDLEGGALVRSFENYFRAGYALYAGTVKDRLKTYEYRGMAINALEKALELRPRDSRYGKLVAETVMLLGRMYTHVSEAEKAVEIVSTYIARENVALEVWIELVFVRSEAYKALGEMRLSLQDAVTAILANPPGTSAMSVSFSDYSKEMFIEFNVDSQGKDYDWFVDMFREKAKKEFKEKGLSQDIYGASRYFALFSMLEKTNRVLAWEFLTIGNSIQHHALQPNLAFIESQFDTIKHVFNWEMLVSFGGLDIGYRPKEKLVFLVGLPRSGSSLVEQILDAHSQITGLGEESEITSFVHEFKDKIVLAASGKLGIGSLRAWVSNECGRVFKTMRSRHESKGRDTVVFIDKMLGHYSNIGLIHIALPSARFIHVSKGEEKAALFSLYRKQFEYDVASWSYDLATMKRFFGLYKSLMAHWRQVLDPGVMFEVTHEDFVMNWVARSKELVRFCGVPWEEGVLNFHLGKRVVTTLSLLQVKQPVSVSFLSKWKPFDGYLSAELADERDEL